MARTFASAFLLASLLAGPALAQVAGAPDPGASPANPPGAGEAAPPSNATREAAAQALFDEAVKLMQAGHYPEACERFASSQKLDPGAGTLLNLATCYEKNRQTASAWATFVEAANVANKAGHPDWAARAEERAQALEPKLARIIVLVPPESAVEGLVVERDSLPVDAGSYGSAIPVDPGQYTFSARAPGKKKGWSTTVTLEAGGRASVTIPELENEPPPPPPPPMEPLRPAPFWSTGRVVGATLASAGVVSLVVGSVLGVQAKSDYDNARNNDCPNMGTRCTPAGVALGQSASTAAAGSTVTFIVGGLALGTGVTLLFLGGPRSNASSTEGAWLRLVPRGGARGGSLDLEGAW
jgi:hypothetical protein